MEQPRDCRWRGSLMGFLLFVGACCAGTTPAQGEVTVRVVPAGDALELEIPTDIGPQKDYIPLYRAGTIRYFSAGIGQVEREAAYPAFSLKLVFTAGGKPFVTGVTVTVRNAQGQKVISVPADHITGPWLFIDLPEGVYEVAASLGGKAQAVKGIKVVRGKVTTQHVRWSEDHSPALTATGE